MIMRRFLPFAAALLLVSCASPEKLTQKSQEELDAGQVQDAYQHAVKALEKQPGYEPARRAVAAAAARWIEQRQEGIFSVASLRDTTGAGDRIVSLDRFRRQVADLHVEVPRDSLYDAREDFLRQAAATLHYNRGLQLLKDDARRSYTEFQATRDLVPGYKDVDSRVHEAYTRAVMRVAILPFANETQQEEISRKLSDQMYKELAENIDSKDFPFTVLIDRSRINSAMTVDDLDHMDRATAIRIGRKAGANRVLVGRLFNLRTETNEDHHTFTVWRRHAETDGKGHEDSRWDSHDMSCVLLDRGVTVSYAYQVVDVVSGEAVASHDGTVNAQAHTYFTSFLPDGEPQDYDLLTPETRHADPDHAKAVEDDWKSHMGKWGVGDVMKKVKSQSTQRATYRENFRHEFASDSRERRVFLGELPPPRELALLALENTWREVLSTLQDLDHQK